MSVEGGSGGVGVAGAASVSGAAIFGMPSLEAAPVVVNAGVVRSLEGFRPMNISDINPIDKGGTIAPTQPLVIAQVEEVAASAWEKSKPLDAKSEAAIVPNVIPAWVPDHLTQPESLVAPLIEPASVLQVSPALEPVIKIGSKIESRVYHQVSPAILLQPALHEEEIEEVLVENRIKEEPVDELEEEEIEEFRLKDLLDEQVSEQRVHDIGKAIDSAGEEAEKEGVSGIEGWRIAKFIRLFMHIGLISQIAKRLGRDGSLDETVEELAVGQFENEDQAKKQSKVIVSWNEPVKTGINGTPVREGAVAKVLKYQPVKGSPSEQVVLRVEKRRNVQVKGQEPVQLGSDVTSEVRESDLRQLSPELAEVF